MSRHLLAKKGEANPAAVHPGGESRFQARRVIVLPSLMLKSDTRPAATLPQPPRPAAKMAERPSERRRKFTFRIAPDRHARFCRHAEMLEISRQELLTRALDAFLAEAGEAGTAHDHAAQPLLPFTAWNTAGWPVPAPDPH